MPVQDSNAVRAVDLLAPPHSRREVELWEVSLSAIVDAYLAETEGLMNGPGTQRSSTSNVRDRNSS